MIIGNNQSFKAQFFTQYHGQKVLRWHQWVPSVGNSPVEFQIPGITKEGWYLELTSIADITEEFAHRIGYGEASKQLLDFYKGNPPIFLFSRMRPEDFDFLRYMGYALPYMGVPVETFIEWGWIKLKSNK